MLMMGKGDFRSPDEGGFANIFKPIGMRSTQVVGKVRRSTKFRRVGHCGTLDPLASVSYTHLTLPTGDLV